ncbi:MAG: tetratricopeptide repeat protein [Anaerolineae bacterium]|nr:tetratricopeptide repeat protein [Anaerolineae bacterium]
MTTTLNVFISSKMLELKPERDALYALLPTLNYGDIKLHAWVFEEDAPAAAKPIREVYLKALQDSALYLGLFWNQYGDYTIDEFERATEWVIERHIYVKDVDADKRDPKLADFLNKHGSVTSGITAKWFKTTDELCDAVKKSIENWIEERLRRRPAAASAVHITDPDDVPERAPKLFGRDDLLQQIAAGLTGNDPLLLQGFSGMGKTALAAQAVFDWLKAGKGNALWLKAGSASAEELFQALARPFGASQAVAAQTGDALLQTVRALLRQSGVKLLVLDDCWNAKALTTVLKAVPSDLPVLLTARREYGIRQTLKVDALLPDQALELLGYHANHNFTDNADAHELCKQLGYLPFALRIAGINLQKKYHLTPAELSLKIKNTTHDLTAPLDFIEEGRENVAGLLKISLNALDAETRAVFIACGAFFAPALTPEMMMRFFVDKPEITEEMLTDARKQNPHLPTDMPDDQVRKLLQNFLMRNIDPEPAEKHLTALAHHGLIEHIPSAEKAVAHYRLHDLAYSYARAANDDAAHHRALEACLAYLKGYNQPSLANFAALRPELPNLLAAADWAFTVGRYADAETCAWDLYAQGSKILNYDGFYNHAIHLLLRAAESAMQQNNPRNQGAHLGNLGNAYRNLGQYDRAIQQYEQALTISREIGDRRSEGNLLGSLGNVYSSLGEYDRTIQYYGQALTISRETGDRRNEGNWLGNLGITYESLGQYDRAIQYYEQALTISQEIGDRRNEGNWLGNLGITYDGLGQYNRAIENCEQALSIHREIGDRRGEGADLGSLGNAYFSLGQCARAIQYYEQALTISREIGDRRSEGSILGNLGITYDSLGEYARAIQYYEQALTIRREIGDRLGEANDLNNIGALYEAQGDYPQAIAYYEQAHAIYAAIGTLHIVEKVDRNLADVRAKLSGGT